MTQIGNEVLILICMRLDVIWDLLLYQAPELTVCWRNCGGHSRPPKYTLHCVWSSDATVNGLIVLVYAATWWRDGKWIHFSHACCWFDWTVSVTGSLKCSTHIKHCTVIAVLMSPLHWHFPDTQCNLGIHMYTLTLTHNNCNNKHL